MDREYFEFNDKEIIISDEKGNMIRKNSNDDVEGLLLTENKIEEINSLIDKLDKEKNDKSNYVYVIKLLIVVMIVSRLVAGISNFLLYRSSILLRVTSHMLLIGGISFIGFIYCNKCKKDIRKIEGQIRYLFKIKNDFEKELIEYKSNDKNKSKERIINENVVIMDNYTFKDKIENRVIVDEKKSHRNKVKKLSRKEK